MQSKKPLKLKSITCLILVVVIAVIGSLLAAPALSVSSSPCSSCHPTYNQQLDIVEGSSQNQIPTAIQVGQTQTVIVVIQNINNVAKYSQLSSVSLTLRSQNGHFTVASPTYSIAALDTGTATASWQITGASTGSDILVISASARNTHQNLQFSDSYAPNPSITVTASTLTPPPTQAPTPISTPTPTPATSPASPTPTTNPSINPSSTPTFTPTATPAPTHSPDSTPTQTPELTTTTPTPTNTNPPNSPSPTSQVGHELNSTMLYIHPPLAIVGFILVFLYAVLMFKNSTGSNFTKKVGLSLWVFTFLGLLTGMLWAQWAWGSYWSWDPKETLTLALFLTVSAAQVAYFEKRYSAAKWVTVLACTLTVVTGLSSFIIVGLHSFG